MDEHKQGYETTFVFLIIFWISLVAGLWVFDTLSQYRFPTTDMGQWIMYSRFYSGESVPFYRVPLGVSPLLPLIIAVLGSILGNSISSALIISGVLMFLLTLFASSLAIELYDDIVGLISCFLFSFGQYFVVYLISFGGLPQLGAMVSTSLGYLGLARYGKRGNISLVTISCILLVLFHFPSAPGYFVTIATSLSFIELNEGKSVIRVIATVAKYLFLPTLIWFLFLFTFFDQQIAYATNPAGFYRRGIEQLIYMWSGLSDNKWVFFLILTATFSIIITPLLYVNKRSEKIHRSTILVLIWFLVPTGLMLTSYLFKVGTDYSRFQFYLITSLLFSVAFVLSRLIGKAIKFFYEDSERQLGWSEWIRRASIIVSVVGLIIIIINNSIFTIRFFPRAVDYYSLDNDKSFLELLSSIGSFPSEKLTLSPFLEAMWIEGLTGQSTIFPNKFRNLYRPGETDRSLIASIVSTGSAIAVENGYIFLRYQHAQVNTLFNPDIAMYRRGEYVDVFNIQDQLIEIEIEEEGKRRELNLKMDFRAMPPVVSNTTEHIRIACDYFWVSNENELKVEKLISISKNSPEVSIVFNVMLKGDHLLLNQINLQLADPVTPGYRDLASKVDPVNQSFPDTITTNPMRVSLLRKELDGGLNHLDLEFSPYPSSFKPLSASKYPGYILVTYSPEAQHAYSIELTIKLHTDTPFREGARVLDLPNIFKDYNIGRLIIEKQNVMAEQIYKELNYRVIYSNQDYVVFSIPD